MSTMRIGSGAMISDGAPTDVELIVDQPIGDLVAGERIWIGDFIKSTDGVAWRSNMREATHAAFHGADEGQPVKCVRFDELAGQS